MSSIQKKAFLFPFLLMLASVLVMEAEFYFFSPLQGKSFNISIETSQKNHLAVELIFEDAPAVSMQYHSPSQSFWFATDSAVRLKEIAVHLKEGIHLNISTLILAIDNHKRILTAGQVQELISQGSNNLHQTKLPSKNELQIEFKENQMPSTANYVKLSPLKLVFFSYSKLQFLIYSVFIVLIILMSVSHYKQLALSLTSISSVQLASIAILIFFGTILYRPSTNNAILLLLPLVAARVYWKDRKFRPFTFLYYLFVLFYLLRVIGLIYTDFLQSGMTTLETCLPFIYFPIVFSIIHFDFRHITFIFRGTYIVTSIIICITLVSLLYNIEIYDYSLKIYFSNIKPLASFLFSWSQSGHPSYLCLAVIIAVVYQLELFQWKKVTISQVVFFHFLTLIYIVLSGARVGYILYPLVLILYFFHSTQMSHSFYRYLIGFGVLTLALLVTFFPGLLYSIDPGRSINWTATHSVIMEKPYIGYGTDGNLILRSVGDWFSVVQNPHLANVHNQYLNEFLQFGIVGLLLLVLTLVFLLINSVRKNDYSSFTLTACIIIFMTFENALSRSYGVGLIILNLCLLSETSQTRNRQFHDQDQKLKHLA